MKINKLLKPGIIILDKLIYPQKVILISFLFVLLYVAIFMLLIPELNKWENFTKK